MARINIENSLLKDGRFIDLCIHFGDKQKALGALVWAFMIAQKHYLDESSDRLIPLSEWQRQSCENKLIDFGFAEMRDNGVYVCGSEKQFAWLVQRVNAGKKGGISSRIKRHKKVAVAKRDQAVEQPPYSLLLSPSSSLPSHNSLLTTPLNIKKSKIEKVAADKSGGSMVWESYRDAFQKRYGVEPVRNAKVNAQCKQIHDRLGSDASEVVGFYLTHNDGWYLKRQHDLGSLLQAAESLHTQWQRGQAVTSAQVRQAEKSIAMSDLISQFEENKNEK